MRFIDPNWDTNIVHKSPIRVNEIHSPVLFRFESTTGLGIIRVRVKVRVRVRVIRVNVFRVKTT